MRDLPRVPSLAAIILGLLAGCGTTHVPQLQTNASTGGGTSGNGQTTGSSGAATTGGGQSTGSSGTSGTTSGTGGGPCWPGATWVGDQCEPTSCAGAPYYAPCQLPDGGPGECLGGLCQPPESGSDSANCGGYGIVCPDGGYCSGSFCAGSSAPCPVNRMAIWTGNCAWAICDGQADDQICSSSFGDLGFCCGKRCISFDASDNLNCGGCGAVCPVGFACQEDVCIQTAVSENGSFCVLSGGGTGIWCGGQCADTGSDSTNCGYCNVTCPMNSTCSNSACTGECGANGYVCPQGFLCVSVNAGLDCLPAACTPASENEPCALDAGVFGFCCGGACSNVAVDDGNCGGCGSTCAAGTTCTGGRCVALGDCVSTSELPCALDGGVGSCCAQRCVDTRSDPLACGVCGLAAPLDAGCSVGVPSMPCAGNAPCPTGFTCVGTTCLTTACGPFDRETPCAYDLHGLFSQGSCCGGSCVDEHVSLTNCGGCGFTVPAGSACGSAAGCVGSCPAGLVCGCGLPTCAGSLNVADFSCHPLSCAGVPDGELCGFGPGGNLGLCVAGSCVNLAIDPENCGAIGSVCPSGVCSYGICIADTPSNDCLASCPASTACAEGTCVDSQCHYRNRGQYCLGADGQIGVCCSVGTCAVLSQDSSNCGACGIACSDGGACGHGSCAGGECGAGRQGSYCRPNETLAAGCCPSGCVDFNVDDFNCGSCGTQCYAGSHCIGGGCY